MGGALPMRAAREQLRGGGGLAPSQPPYQGPGPVRQYQMQLAESAKHCFGLHVPSESIAGGVHGGRAPHPGSGPVRSDVRLPTVCLFAEDDYY